jgi:hypothetical protein
MEKYQQDMWDRINSGTAKTTITLARQHGRQAYTWYDEVNNTIFDRQYNWCLENLGPATDYPPRWQPIGIGQARFRFRDPRDETLFLLRWGG